MKTVQAQVLSSKPTSLPGATSFLSGFNNSICSGESGASVGASHETCWFVRRALASFEELEKLHRKLKGRRHGSESQNDDVQTTVGDNQAQSFVAGRDVSSKLKSDGNRKVEVEKQSLEEGKVGNLGEGGGEIAKRVGDVEEVDDKKKKKKKKTDAIDESKMGNEEVKRESDFGDFEQDESQNKKKEKKKKRDNVGNADEEEEKRGEKKRKRKRKSGELENGDVEALEEQQEKRKKRR